MNCKKIEKKVIVAIDNKYLLQSDSKLKEHLEHCLGCRAFYEQLLLENEYLIDAGASFEPPAGLEARIISNLPPMTNAEYRRTYRRVYYAAAAGIVVIIAIIFSYPKHRVGTVELVKGHLQIKTLFGWKDLDQGKAIRDKAVLRTLADSKATIVFEEGNYLRLDPKSSVYLGARVHKDKEHIYRLEYGSIWAKVHHSYDGEFYIETPNALIIRVIGTEFNVRAVPSPNPE